MPYSQKYCLVHFIASIQPGDKFRMADWPPHVTLADVFAIDFQKAGIGEALSVLTAKSHTVRTYAIQSSTLGTTPVILLERNSGILSLHTAIINLLESNGAAFNTPEFTRDGFIPHCTIQKGHKLTIGSEVVIDTLSLVDMFPGGDWTLRKVLHTFKLED